MIHSGLVSITFRKLTPREIVDLVAQAGLEGIEWGGDIHVPHGDVKTAREVAAMTHDAGLKVASYGSYYKVGHDAPVPFERVIITAQALGAPTIRVWAGKLGPEKADAAYRVRVVEESRRIADAAQDVGLTISFEFHRETLTETTESALQLLKEIGHPATRCYWQPSSGTPLEGRVESIKSILPWLANFHCYCWRAGGDRRPLADAHADWVTYFRTAGPADRYALIEFVKDDSPAQFLADAEALKAMLAEAQR